MSRTHHHIVTASARAPQRTLLVWAILCSLLCYASYVEAQQKKPAKAPAKVKTKSSAAPTTPAKPVAPKVEAPANLIHLMGIRPGISTDSLRRIAANAGVELREVQQDTLTHCFADQSIHIYVIDSIYARLTYMRMSFLVDGTSNHLRRFTITPRESAIQSGRDGDLQAILLLYFGQTWGKPELNLDPPLPNFRWRTGNIEVRGFIRRGYPVWVMEG